MTVLRSRAVVIALQPCSACLVARLALKMEFRVLNGYLTVHFVPVRRFGVLSRIFSSYAVLLLCSYANLF